MIPGRGNLKFKVSAVKETFKKMKMMRQKWPDNAMVRCLNFLWRTVLWMGRRYLCLWCVCKVTGYKVVCIFNGLSYIIIRKKSVELVIYRFKKMIVLTWEKLVKDKNEWMVGQCSYNTIKQPRSDTAIRNEGAQKSIKV